MILCFALGKPPAAGYSDLQEVLLNRLLGGVMALFLVLPAVFGPTPAAGRVGDGATAAGVDGLISYGIYLWHLNVLEQVAGHVQVSHDNSFSAFIGLAVLTLVATLAVASASYSSSSVHCCGSRSGTPRRHPRARRRPEPVSRNRRRRAANRREPKSFVHRPGTRLSTTIAITPLSATKRRGWLA